MGEIRPDLQVDERVDFQGEHEEFEAVQQRHSQCHVQNRRVSVDDQFDQ